MDCVRREVVDLVVDNEEHREYAHGNGRKEQHIHGLRRTRTPVASKRARRRLPTPLLPSSVDTVETHCQGHQDPSK